MLVILFIGLLLIGLALIWLDLSRMKKGKKLPSSFLRPQLLGGICVGVSLLIFFSLVHFSSLQAAIFFVSLIVILVLVRIGTTLTRNKKR